VGIATQFFDGWGRSLPWSRRYESAVLQSQLVGDVPESSAVGESVERRGDSEEEEQRQPIDESTELLDRTRGH